MDLTPTPPEQPKIVAMSPHAQAELDIRMKADEAFRRCSGRHRQVMVDEIARTVTCEACGYVLDPFEYLLDWARDGHRQVEGLKRLAHDRRIAQAEHDDLVRRVKNLRATLKRGGRPQSAKDRHPFDVLRWNPQLLREAGPISGVDAAVHPCEPGPMTPNRESVEGKLVKTFDEGDVVGPGAFLWDIQGARRSLVFILPGEDYYRSIQVVHGPAPGEQVWGWDGNEERPTITPSILAYDRDAPGQRVEHWHGWLRAGRFESC